MDFLDLGENLLTIVLFSLVCGVFGWAIHYLIRSIENFKQIKSDNATQKIPGIITEENNSKPLIKIPKFSLNKLKALFPKRSKKTETKISIKSEKSISKAVAQPVTVKEAIIQQQEYFNALVSQMQKEEESTNNKINVVEEEWQGKVEELELKLEEKEEELYQLKKQKEITEKMVFRLNEVQKEFNLLKDKITGLEAQASRSNQLAMELEDLKIAFNEIKKDGIRKQDKIQDLVSENGRLQHLLADTEDKLNEANMQRQQMQKKISYLEDINEDFSRVTEANKKLQNEMRRIGELESLLNMITEERDQLLRNRY